MGLTFNEFNSARYVAEIENEARDGGIERGLEQGLARERTLLRDLAAVRFDEATAERLAEPLNRINDFDRLAEIGKWIVSCETGDELLTRLNGSGSHPNGSRSRPNGNG